MDDIATQPVGSLELPVRWKPYALALLAAVAGMVGIITQCINDPNTPVPVPGMSASPSPSPSVSPGLVQVEVLNSFERPEYADASLWKSQASRTISTTAQTGFVLRVKDGVNPCELVGSENNQVQLQKMQRIAIARPSYEGGKVGDFFDPLVPFNDKTCQDAKYLWLEIEKPCNESAQCVRELAIGGAKIKLDYLSVGFPKDPVMPFYVGLHQNYLQPGHFGKPYGGQEGKLSKLWLEMMKKNRLYPTSQAIAGLPIVNGALNLDLNAGLGQSFRQNVVDYSPLTISFSSPLTSLPSIAWLQALQQTIAAEKLEGRAWIYAQDEPSTADLPALAARLKAIKQSAPSVLTMATVGYKPELHPYLDIYVPNFQGWQDGPQYDGKKIWLYGSCVSHWCSLKDGDVFGRDDFRSGKDEGTPDLVLDRPAANPLAFILLGMLHYPRVSGMFYYSVNELERFGADSRTINGIWAFGGWQDGQLAYSIRPGEFGSADHAAAPSIRAKLLREASFLADLYSMVLAKDAAFAKAELAKVIRDAKDWERDASKWMAFRDALVGKLK